MPTAYPRRWRGGNRTCAEDREVGSNHRSRAKRRTGLDEWLPRVARRLPWMTKRLPFIAERFPGSDRRFSRIGRRRRRIDRRLPRIAGDSLDPGNSIGEAADHSRRAGSDPGAPQEGYAQPGSGKPAPSDDARGPTRRARVSHPDSPVAASRSPGSRIDPRGSGRNSVDRASAPIDPAATRADRDATPVRRQTAPVIGRRFQRIEATCDPVAEPRDVVAGTGGRHPR